MKDIITFIKESNEKSLYDYTSVHLKEIDKVIDLLQNSQTHAGW